MDTRSALIVRGALRRLATVLLLICLTASGCSEDTSGVSNPRTTTGASALSSATSDLPAPTATPTETPSAIPTADASRRCLGREVTMLGTPKADHLRASQNKDVILALGGDDVISGLGPHDRVCAGGGDDALVGAHMWFDSADLGAGDDRVESGDASQLWAGPGDDVLRLRGTTQAHPGPGDDTLMAQWRGMRSRLGASGSPCLSYDELRHGVVAHLDRGRVHAQGLDRVRGMVRCLFGTRHADVIRGTRLGDQLEGGGGSDRVFAGAGIDIVTLGGAGATYVSLGPGDDTVMGSGGPDRIYGDDGADSIWGLKGSDHLVGGDGDDQVNGTYYCDVGSSAGDGMGDRSPNQVYGGNGDDEVTGDLAADLIDGGPGLDHGYGGPSGHPGDDLIVSVERLTVCP